MLGEGILVRAGLVLVISGLISGAGTGVLVEVAKKVGWVDDPKKKRRAGNVVHDYPVPRGGGVPLVLAVVVGAIIFLPLDKHLWGILAGAGLTAVVGLLDDIYDLSPKIRLITNIMAAGLVVASGVGIAFLNNPLGNGVIDLSWPRLEFSFLGEQRSIWILSDLFALVWVVGLMNLVGWSAGVDGQLPGMVVIAAVVIGLLSLRFSTDVTQWPVIILAALVAGAYLGFLPWNVYPQKIMPGYGGKSLAGFLLAVLAILSTTKVGTIMVVLGVPILDGIYTLARRLLSGKMPWWGDRGHLHHRLLDAGWGKRRIAGFYWLVTAILGVAALQLNSQQKLYTIVGVGLVIGLVIAWLSWPKTSLKVFGRDSG